MATTQQVRIETLLETVLKKDASDLHIQLASKPMLRIDGQLVPVENSTELTEEQVESLIFSVLDDDQKKILLKDKEIDFSFAFGDLGRFRANAFHERGNLALALRLIPNEIRTITDLGLPKVVSAFTEYGRGLVLVTGPTGSGKSTTLAAMIDKINEEKATHIITIEDPIEYIHKSKKALIVQRELHYDTVSFGEALRSSLRQDPDVILVGEMRDLDTISTAITLAETGHLVFATLHTNSAAQTVDRLVDVFPPHQQQQIRTQLAGILQGVVSQRLIPMVGGGRMAAAEILVATSAVRNIIREGKSHQLESVIQTGAEYGMQSMDKTLVKLIHSGKITYEEAVNYAVDIEELDRLMRS
ncbi:TPA: type IV pilus twitching motility protein PilT [Candidatus Saccharibacteria bacterium]|nr:type IV pilus twitching motility protein PilT [Candidatus Saccharibacteria bacterium]HIO87704.1 type IV pilus twitching motility protein PilT [Candidatus Saccharibacteria bacterium]